jgi:predicted HAD superfamily Cof-like phosphohydrolase
VTKTREAYLTEFHTAFGAAINELPTVELLRLRKALIEEEANELYQEFDTAIALIEKGQEVPRELWAAMLKEAADVQVVLSGAAVALRPLRNFEEAFIRVHESNMSKLGVDGKPVLREDGKILKGPNYAKPDLLDLV